MQLDYSLNPNRTRRAQARSWLTCSSAGDDVWAETGIGPAAQLKCIFSSSRLCRLRVGVAECYPLFSANLDITTWRRSDLRGDPLITPILEAINSSRDHPLITGMGRRSRNPSSPAAFSDHRERTPNRRIGVLGRRLVVEEAQHGAPHGFGAPERWIAREVVSRVAASEATAQCDTRSARAPA